MPTIWEEDCVAQKKAVGEVTDALLGLMWPEDSASVHYGLRRDCRTVIGDTRSSETGHKIKRSLTSELECM